MLIDFVLRKSAEYARLRIILRDQPAGLTP